MVDCAAEGRVIACTNKQVLDNAVMIDDISGGNESTIVKRRVPVAFGYDWLSDFRLANELAELVHRYSWTSESILSAINDCNGSASSGMTSFQLW